MSSGYATYDESSVVLYMCVCGSYIRICIVMLVEITTWFTCIFGVGLLLCEESSRRFGSFRNEYWRLIIMMPERIHTDSGMCVCVSQNSKREAFMGSRMHTSIIVFSKVTGLSAFISAPSGRRFSNFQDNILFTFPTNQMIAMRDK